MIATRVCQLSSPWRPLPFSIRLATSCLAATGMAWGHPGTLDMSFSAEGEIDGIVYTMAAQATGKVEVGGDFTTKAQNANLARLESNGHIDSSFRAPALNGSVLTLAIQHSSDVLLVGGDFDSVNGFPHSCLARLRATGTLDSTLTIGTDYPVNSLAVGPEGEFYLGGYFTYLTKGTREVSQNYAASILGNTIRNWNPGGGYAFDGPDSTVYAIVSQPETSGILIAGEFLHILSGDDMVGRKGIARLTSSGGKNDPTFDPGSGFDGRVYALAVEPGGMILAGGSFSIFNGVKHQALVRLDSHGKLDPTFGPQFEPKTAVQTLAIQPDGKILVGGEFETVNGQRSASFARLLRDGTLDPSFAVGAAIEDGAVLTILPLTNGQILVGGDFVTINGLTRKGVARLNGDNAPRITVAPLPRRTTSEPASGLKCRQTVQAS